MTNSDKPTGRHAPEAVELDAATKARIRAEEVERAKVRAELAGEAAEKPELTKVAPPLKPAQNFKLSGVGPANPQVDPASMKMTRGAWLAVAVIIGTIVYVVSLPGLVPTRAPATVTAPTPAPTPATVAPPDTSPLNQDAAAEFTPQQLLELTQKPTDFKPTDSGVGNVNSGVSAMYWKWGDPLEKGVKLTRLNDVVADWQLDLSSRAYTVAQIASQSQLLATITDPVVSGPIDLYLIKDGVFKDQYLVQQRFNDGGLGLAVVTKAYATTAAQASELQQEGESQIYSYPLGTFLLYNAAFCSTAGAVCK